MIEKERDFVDQPNTTLVDSQPRLIVETRKYKDVIMPSPLEEAFDTEIQGRFHTALLEPVFERNRLRRISYPTVIEEDNLVVFQYTRYDLLLGPQKKVVDMLLSLNPSLEPYVQRFEKDKHEADEGNPWDSVENILRKEQKIINLLKQRIVCREGVIDLKKALSDPTYYTEGTPVIQWPESFEFVIFGADNNFKHSLHPTQIERFGKFEGKWADFYGELNINAHFQGGITGSSPEKEGLEIFLPRAYKQLAKSYAKQFLNYTDESMRNSGLDYGDVSFFGKEDLSLFLNTDLVYLPPSKMMEKLGNFISELTKT